MLPEASMPKTAGGEIVVDEDVDDTGISLREGTISLILDSYDDLFSDFDARPYEVKALSHDFLQELKGASLDKSAGNLELRLLVPKKKRNLFDEAQIKRRLKDHFQKHHKAENKKRKETRKEGFLWFGIGAVLIAAAIAVYEQGGATSFLNVIFEPAGWFTSWTGLEKIFIHSREKHQDLEFYEKMAGIKIVFLSY
jgi:hypothetical protein